jgi:hypothetical protein
MIPAPQYTLIEGFGVCLAMCQRALAEVRALARLPGPRGDTGPEGKQGLQGERGEKGEPGRNAADLTYLQDYAAEQVGRAFKTVTVTTPDGGRTLRWAVGDIVHEIKTAVVLDAGIWKEGTSYVAGDGVTMSGSFFIAQTTTTAKPEDKSGDWRLAVKRGHDGRDYRSDDKSSSKPLRFK